MSWNYQRYDHEGTLNFYSSGLNYPLQLHGVFDTVPRVGGSRSINRTIVSDDSHVYFSTYNKIYALDINGERTDQSYTDTAILWDYTSDPNYSIDYLTISGDRLYATASGSGVGSVVIALNISNGTEIWSHSASDIFVPGDANIAGPVIVNSWDEIHFPVYATTSSWPSLTVRWVWQRMDLDSNGNVESVNMSATIQNSLLSLLIPNEDPEFETSAPCANENKTEYYLITYAGYQNQITAGRSGTSTFCKIDRNLNLTTTNIQDAESNNVAFPCRGLAVRNDIVVYGTSGVGLYQFRVDTNIISARHTNDSGKLSSAPAVTDTRIYYRSDNVLYAVSDALGSLTEEWSSSTALPPSKLSGLDPISLEPIIFNVDEESKYNLVIPSANDDAIANVHFIKDEGSSPSLLSASRASESPSYMREMAIIGPHAENSASLITNILESTDGYLYVLDATTPPTTTTTTTPPTTTTTTTTPFPGYQKPQVIVETVIIYIPEEETSTTTTLIEAPEEDIISPTTITTATGEVFEISQKTNASESPDTKETVFSKSMTFGTLAPGETSRTMVVALNVPNVKAITNIKLGLMNTGNIDFANNVFGIHNDYRLSRSIIPESYFQGVNTTGEASNQYNIDIPTREANISDYVYLNINVPSDSIPEASVIRYRWFFDFAE